MEDLLSGCHAEAEKQVLTNISESEIGIWIFQCAELLHLFLFILPCLLPFIFLLLEPQKDSLCISPSKKDAQSMIYLCLFLIFTLYPDQFWEWLQKLCSNFDGVKVKVNRDKKKRRKRIPNKQGFQLHTHFLHRVYYSEVSKGIHWKLLLSVKKGESG